MNDERPSFPVAPDECEALNGHCFKRSGLVLASSPPQYEEYCKHCGKVRYATSREPWSYRYVD